ncbi:hypothetical protein AERO8C_130036 [Aeromonas veronii]|uniref:Uncharacterized protein n=1 Tax=Aeromonas veronii TaxID=654 RepID=A0A653KUJ7_AERVE|nr:hypothetical protein AERO8C_130036 [Aeromonas veronii]
MYIVWVLVSNTYIRTVLLVSSNGLCDFFYIGIRFFIIAAKDSH